MDENKKDQKREKQLGENVHDEMTHESLKQKNLIEIDNILNNIEIVVNFLTENVNIDCIEMIDSLIEFRYKYLEGEWDRKDEKKFWIALYKINGKIYPTTVTSIIANSRKSTENRDKKFSNPVKIVRKYSVASLIVFMVLLFIQIYVIKGGYLISELNNLLIQEDKLQTEITEMINMGKATQNKFIYTDKILILSDEKAEVRDLISQNSELLSNWRSIMSIFTLQYDKKIQTNNSDENKQVDLNSDYFQNAGIICTNVQISSHIYRVLKSYHLPILYGLLGAIVYILRTLSFSLRRLSFKKRDLINFRLHLILGSFAGLIIGLFIVRDDSSIIPSIGNLSTVGLAFIAGYSSEFLFSYIEHYTRLRPKPNKLVNSEEKESDDGDR